MKEQLKKFLKSKYSPVFFAIVIVSLIGSAIFNMLPMSKVTKVEPKIEIVEDDTIEDALQDVLGDKLQYIKDVIKKIK